MKRTILSFLFLLTITFYSCTSDSPTTDQVQDYVEVEGTFYGEQFRPANVVTAASIISNLTEDPSEVMQVRGVVVEVCQSKGCWLALELDGPETMRMTFKDYDFFVPKDIAGTEVIAQGEAWLNKTSVSTLRHYAEDAGHDEDKIAAITSDKMEFFFEASGVLIQ